MNIPEKTISQIAQELLELNTGQAVIWGNRAWIVEDVSDAIVPIHKDQAAAFNAHVETYVISRSPSMTSLGHLENELKGIEGIFVEHLNEQYFKCANGSSHREYIVKDIWQEITL